MNLWREAFLLLCAAGGLWGMHLCWSSWQQQNNGAALVAAVGIYAAVLQLWRYPR